MVVGTVTETEDPPTVNATVISAGTKNQYLTFLRKGDSLGVGGWILLVSGSFVLGRAVICVVRLRQPRQDTAL